MAKNQIKMTLKSVHRKYVDFRRNQNDLKTVTKQIQNSKEPVPELEEQQKAEIKEYWSKYGIEVPLEWHRLIYAKTGIVNPAFVPEPVFHRTIKPYMNNHTFAGVWSDKAYIDYFIHEVKSVQCVVRNVNGRFLDDKFSLISMEEAQAILETYDELVIKPSTYTDTGKGVKLLHNPFNLYELAKEYKKNYVIQVPLRQHTELAKLNVSSVNTIRVNSVLFDKEAHVMSAFIKVGQAGQFADNNGHERYFIGIKENGTFVDYAINHDLQKFSSIPSGYKFAGQKVPCFDKVCRAVERAHKCIPHFGFAFWDVCVNEEGEPVIVEINLRYPDTVIPQVAGNPFLGMYTDDILKYINMRQKDMFYIRK